MKRFKKMTLFLKNKNIEKMSEAELLELYHSQFQKKRKYDIKNWVKLKKKDKKRVNIGVNAPYNRFKYEMAGNCRCLFLLKVIKAFFARKKSVLFKRGTHLISGLMGTGKTLLANYIIKKVDAKRYFFYTTKKEFSSENVYYLPMEILFRDHEQKYSIPVRDKKGRYLYGIIADEINSEYNRRMNRTRNYNDTFMGLVKFIATSRHQGINRIYFLGQKVELQDTQLIALMKFNHECIFTKLKYSYQHFKENEKQQINLYPKKILINHYIKTYQGEFVPMKHFKEKVKIDRYIYGTYNTHALADEYIKLQSFSDAVRNNIAKTNKS